MRRTFHQPEFGVRGRVGAAVLTVLLLVTVLVGGRAELSFAAAPGPGVTFDEIGHIGAYRLSSGELAYCLEAGVFEPWGDQADGKVVTFLPSFTGSAGAGWQFGFADTLNMPAVTDTARMRQMNYVIHTWGNTSNNEQAAATQLAIFQIRGDQSNFVTRMIASIREHGGGAVIDRAAVMVAAARVEAVVPTPSASPELPIIDVDEFGVGSVSYSEGTKQLKLTNAVFTDTNDNVISVSAKEGGALNIVGVKPSGWDRDYEVGVSADWGSGQEGWQAALRVHGPVVTGQQRIATAVGATTGNAKAQTLNATVTVSHTWWPTVTTSVAERIVAPGDPFVDTVTIDADPAGGSWGTNESGDYMPIRALGILYGPFDSDPSLQSSDSPPEDAPVAAQSEILTDRGPGTYEVRTEERAFSAGYYNWVWRIDWNNQIEEVTTPERTNKSSLLQNKLPVHDRFGEVAETHTVAQRLTIATNLVDQQIGRGWSLVDEIGVTPERGDGWIRDEQGDVIPVTLRGTVYHSEEAPTQTSLPPESATEIAQATVVVRGAEIVESDSIPISLDLEGYVTAQWCVVDSDQPEHLRGLTRQWCDDYGVPAETAEIIAPIVTTKAQEKAYLNDEISDLAFIEGLVPNESSLEFIAYLKPEAGEPKFDKNWDPIVSLTGAQKSAEVWTQAEIDELGVTACFAQPVAKTKRIEVTHAGEVRSPFITAKSAGTLYWVERLFAVDPISNEEHLIHEGECGLPNETTTVHETGETTPVEKAKTLATTGRVGNLVPFLGVAGVLGVMGATLLTLRRRKNIAEYNELSRSCSPDS